MKFGICCNVENMATFDGVPFDYAEIPLAATLMDDSADFNTTAQKIAESPFPVRSANVFLPGTLKIAGPEVDPEAIGNYLETVCRRAAQVGIELIVWGSNKARSIPEDFPREKAYEQLAEFARTLDPIARKNNLLVVIEPLSDCNTLTTLKESAEFARKLNLPNIRLLVDSHHWNITHDTVQDILDAADLISHIHIRGINYDPPGVDDEDYTDFFTALKKINYSGNVSLECRWNMPESEIPAAANKALAIVKNGLK